MEIHSGKLFKNKTWRYIYPTLKYYGPDLDNYITSFIKLNIGIGDTNVAFEEDNLFILFDVELRNHMQINLQKYREKFQQFLHFVRIQHYYTSDYEYKYGKFNTGHMVVLKIPYVFKNAMYNFIKGKYSLMYSEEQVKKYFGFRKFENKTLEVKYKGKSISDVLDMTIKEAYEFFENIPKIKNKLETLVNVGLDYIRLGQSATTLSGGEAQRVKLASELYKKSTGKTLYILDEPTTGLHIDDISRLIKIINKLVDGGNTVVVIEHNLDVIKCCDYLIDLGPEGGVGGGTILDECTPEKLIENSQSYTGKFLKKLL